jgi:hypothetical protein
VMLSTLAVTWPLFGFASSLGYTFSFPNRHRPPLSESLPFDLLSVFFVIVGCVILYCLLRYLLRPRPNDVLPGPASVTEDDFVPGPEGQPGEQVSFWSERFGAPRFVIRWLLFAFLIALVHHAINLYFAHV